MRPTLYLRKPRQEDIESLIKLYESSTSLHQPWVYPPDDLVQYIAEPYRYLLCLEGDENIAGTFNISGVVRGYFQSAYLGYEVFRPYDKQGFMRKGIQLLIDKAFGELHLHRLEANIQPENLGSVNLVRQSGFVKEGYSKKYLNIGGLGWKDHERWALLNDEWQ